ncbi:hypothetical protein FQB35_07555 [Crassaminicella thermophila]|uniref:Uncharacterized protein n=1 Tax=Crassaminicella thermophila TaxID=2599308 RepID=A0A5C0SDR3_CRATE|nr:hypothetical protein [Crassaminicella thermophila]QEK12240.1 hypothetical protein FQB35_07555 [Crassaminicella thermophila]
MKIVPDVVGFPLEKAINLCKLSEIQISIKKTQSPKMLEEAGECRVIKQENIDKYIELIVSYF